MSFFEFGCYLEVKASNSDWLGAIPSHWELVPLKHLCNFAGGGTPSKDTPEYWTNGNIPWVSPKDMKQFRLSKTQDQITVKAIRESATGLIPSGSLIVVVRSGILQRTIPVAINSVPVTLNQDMKALTFKEVRESEFIAYLIQGHEQELIRRWTKEGATVESIEHEFLANELVPAIAAEERNAIVTFLDRETAKIDALIEKQQQLIALLQEKRQAIISHAVTKGLNPDAPMRDSGVEWLRDVPAHWHTRRAKYLFEEKNRTIYPDDEIVTAFRDGQVCLRSRRRTTGYTFAILEQGYQGIKTGDLVIHSMDAFAGAIGVSEDNGKATPEYVVVTPYDESLNMHYFAAILRVMAKRDYIFVLCPSVRERAPRFRFSKFQEVLLPVPPPDEQSAIIDYLRKSTDLFTELIDKAAQQINLLQERRTALISAAVTGKIDVRSWKPEEESP